jgi:hypothetical protein
MALCGREVGFVRLELDPRVPFVPSNEQMERFMQKVLTAGVSKEKKEVSRPRAVFCNQLINPANVLLFAALAAKATESNPLKLGNVEFWVGTGPWEGQLIHDPPSNQWDKPAVQIDLNLYLADKMESLKEYIGAQYWPEVLEVTKNA